MALAEQDILAVEEIIERRLQKGGDLFAKIIPASYRDDRELFERVVRIEEELRHQRELIYQNQELMKLFMQQMDKRFESMQHNMDKRFEQVDKRFESMQRNMDRRFRTVQWFLGLGFTVLAVLMSLYNFIS
ncbi:hypothetical protein P0082_11255 [Candidatus Haliotispira prima]|uniref:DUF1640 domain-containing protein n=1 Tax=Candidatus Haliotispira prima TaxID=3034016 RepID=A0ABY8MIL4_9SPIO|nr:hypothetical protein P0082_11255 [Candidatus Haliotispira prima]